MESIHPSDRLSGSTDMFRKIICRLSQNLFSQIPDTLSVVNF